MDALFKRRLLALLLIVPSVGYAAGNGRRGHVPKPPSGPSRPVIPSVSVPKIPSGLIPALDAKILPEGVRDGALPRAVDPSAVILPPSSVPAAPQAHAAPPSASAKDELGGLHEGLASGKDGAAEKIIDGSEAPDAAKEVRAARPTLNFYNRQQPSSSQKPKIRKHQPSAEETARARAAFLKIEADGEELFNAPTWLEKAYFPELKATIFGIATLDEALTDFANKENADIPDDIPAGVDVLTVLLERRAALVARYQAEVLRIEALPRTKAQRLAWKELETAYSRGLVSSFLDNADALHPWPFRRAAMAFRQLRKIALGRNKAAKPKEVRELALEFRAALYEGLGLHEAKQLDTAFNALLGTPRATKEEAKRIYDGALGEAKNGNLALNQAHLAARALAADQGTVFIAPNLGKQIRPTCTVHMMQSLLASMGVHRGLKSLIKEARVLLNDPYVGMTTPFNLEMQQRLFRHYGRIALMKEGLFETIVKKRRVIKVGVEIGDPVYKHSLVLEGFYRLDGKTYVALRDSTSYFPIRFTIEDFAKIMTGDDAVVFLEAYARPHGLPHR